MPVSRFPLVNIRKSINGIWSQLYEPNESITVPGSASNYIVQLVEVPDNGSVNSKPIISGLTRSEIYPPSAGEFWVNYATGNIQFNVAEEGQTFSVAYWKRGSLVDSTDINLLYNRIIEFNRNPTLTDSGFEVGTLWVNSVTNDYFICTKNTINTSIWVARATGGTASIPSFIYISLSASDTWDIEHNLGIMYPNVEVYEDTNNVIIPFDITAIDENNMVITFPEPVAGRAILIFGTGTSGTSGGGVSGSSGTSGTSGTSLSDIEKLNLELEMSFKMAEINNYKELTYVGGNLVTITIYKSIAKLVTLFDKVLSYTSGDLTGIVLTRHSDNVKLTKTLAYDIDGNLINIIQAKT